MKKDGELMHQEGNRAVKTALDNFLTTVPTALAGAYNAVIEQIMGEVRLLFEQNTADGNRNSTRRVRSNNKVRL
jgi:hypothetical protein